MGTLLSGELLNEDTYTLRNALIKAVRSSTPHLHSFRFKEIAVSVHVLCHIYFIHYFLRFVEIIAVQRI